MRVKEASSGMVTCFTRPNSTLIINLEPSMDSVVRENLRDTSNQNDWMSNAGTVRLRDKEVVPFVTASQ